MDDNVMFILKCTLELCSAIIAVQTLKKEGFDWLSMAFIS